MTEREIWIHDLDDPRLAPYRHLKTHNSTRDQDLFVLEGAKLFDRLLLSRYPVDTVLVSDRFVAEISPRVPAGVPLYVVAHAHVSEIVGFNFHQGVLACGRRQPPLDVEQLVKTAPAGAGSTLLVAPQVDNPENLGALVRIADVFGVLAVVTGPRSPDPLSRRVLRVSMGTALRVPVVTASDLIATLDRLRRRHGYQVVATVTSPAACALDAYAPPPSGRIALAFGCEAHGLDKTWLAFSDQVLTIPMRPDAESLNLAVAAGIVTHHATRALRPPPS
ncbi:MAG: RNA methyltransferase [Isosphaeraceae bacterium]